MPWSSRRVLQTRSVGGDALPVPGPAHLRAAERAYTRRPTPRLTRVPVSSRPQSLHRLQHRHRFGNLCARSPAAYLRRASGPPPAAANHCTTRRRRGRSSQPLAGLPMQRARRRGVDSHRTPRPQINKPESLSTSRKRAMVGPMKTSGYHSTISEWPSSNRPDFPPASPCGNREFWADVPHRNRDHQTYGAVRRVHSFFPYNVTDARRWVLCAARYVFLQRTLKPRGDRVGALGGQYGRRSTPRQLRCHRPTPRQLRV